MKTLTLIFVAAFLLIMLELQGQTLVNGLAMNSLYVEMNGSKIIESRSEGRLLLPNTPTSIALYQDDERTYWVSFSLKQCGKKARLKSRTFLELKDGEIIAGSSEAVSRRADKGEYGWITGSFADEFQVGQHDDEAFQAGFDYAMRFSN